MSGNVWIWLPPLLLMAIMLLAWGLQEFHDRMSFRSIRQWRCGRRGHPYPPIEIPICGQRPDEPETDQLFCSHCGARLSTRYTDGAGTEIRDA